MTDTEPARGHQLDDYTLKQLYPRLRRFAAVVAPIEVAPDDLVQEALTRLLAHGVGDVAHLEAYLRQIMVRSASNHRRRLGRARRAFDRLANLDRQTVAAAEYPSDVAFLELIGPRARAVLFLHEVEGMELRAVAALLGLTEGAVKQAAVRGRRRLRHHLDEGAGS